MEDLGNSIGLGYRSAQRLKEMLRGKSPSQFLMEKGYIKTFMGWVKKHLWDTAQSNRAVVDFDNFKAFTTEYDPSTVFNFLQEKGELQRPIKNTAPLSRAEMIAEEFKGF